MGRMFGIDIETCTACGGAARVIVSIEDPVVIEKILAHVRQGEPPGGRSRRGQPRAPPNG
jgi:hypothetical protein